ncbi:MAG TPA: 50S ribosomal protein L11 methyltransferase [Candidatus Synoicihabitans sp.]|nr:50S ribosomal protein L11 methyltransferase [Candidatus Synoicihabitans sp.]
MKLFEIRVEIRFDAAETVNEVLLEAEDDRWSLLEDIVIRRAWIVGIFEDEDAARVSWEALQTQVPSIGEPAVRALAETDWRDSYKLHFKAWRCGRLHLVPVWERRTYDLPRGDVAIWLDPGLAFGTGNHETTRLCCERLVAWAEAQPPESRVIDAGCGSGILALSAARLGFVNVQGFDNDPEAVRVSRENAALNDLSRAVEFATADLVTGLAGVEAELVLANIQSDVLIRYARPLIGAVAFGGTLALSGILSREREQVIDAFAQFARGWKIESRVLGEWCDVVLVRPM